MTAAVTAATPTTVDTAAVLVSTTTDDPLVELIVRRLAELGGLAILAGIVALVVAFGYRWYVREPIPRGLAVLLGLGAVAALLNTTEILGAIIAGDNDVTQIQAALLNIGAFAAGLLGAYAGRRVGDSFGTEVFEATSFGAVEEDVGRLVTALGRVVTVQLPDEIDDVVGYDPVPEATKEQLAGRSFVFPRRLTVGELRDRLVARLKTDYAVGHVDVELTADGTVEYLGVGSRAAGIGPTLPPSTNAMAIRADPAFAASAGDLVQVWELSPTRRVLTAELRGVADDVVTVAIDAADTSKLDPTTEYRLVTLPVEDRPDREFVSLLRAADETFASVTVGAGSALDGATVGSLPVATIGVTPDGGEPEVLPTADRTLAPGEVVHAIARPEALRRLRADSEGDSETADAAVAADDAGVGSAVEGEADGEATDEESAGGESADGESTGGESADGTGDASGSPDAGSSGVEGGRDDDAVSDDRATGEETADRDVGATVDDEEPPGDRPGEQTTEDREDGDEATDEPRAEDGDAGRRDE